MRALGKAEPVSVRMTITPQDAQFLLDTDAEIRAKSGEPNRHLEAKRVTRFANVIRKGQWKLTHQGLALAPDGKVLDGQHRLAAVVEAGIAVEIAVSQDDFDFAVFDTGKSRSPGDVLHIAGRKSTPQLAAALKLIAIYDAREPRPWTSVRRNFSNPDILQLANESMPYIDDCVRQATLVARRIGGSRSSITAGLYVCRRWALDKGLLEEYLEFENGLTSGVGMLPGDARLALANWLASTSGKGAGRIRSNEHRSEIAMLLVLRAFVAFLRGEFLSRMLISNAAEWTYRLPLRAMKETYRGVVPGVTRPVVLGALESEEEEE